MAYESNEIQIVLFQNKQKKNPKGPDATGSVTFPDGTKYEVALWNRVSKNGNAFQSGLLRLPNQTQAPRSSAPAPKSNEVEIDF
jgi:hypothetical protein